MAATRPTAPESARRCSRTRWSIGRLWTQYVDDYGPLVAADPDDRRQSRKALNAELELTRSRGFALDLEENEPGVHCAAIAVTLGTGRPVAAVSVTAPTMRITREQLDEIGLDLLARVAASRARRQQPRQTDEEISMTTVVFVGAGSVEFTRDLLSDFFGYDDLGPLTIRLHDIDPERLADRSGHRPPGPRASRRNGGDHRAPAIGPRRSTAPTS